MKLSNLNKQPESEEETQRQLFLHHRTEPYALENLEVVMDHIQSMDIDGSKTDLRIEEMPSCIPLDSGSVFTERYHEIKKWALEEDVEISPFFAERELEFEVYDKNHSVLIPPSFTLLSYLDDEPEFMAPFRSGDKTYDVIDVIDGFNR